MKNTFVIPPYVNLMFTENVQQKVEENTSDDPIHGKKLQNKQKATFLHFQNGEKRFVLVLPVKIGNRFIQGIFPDPVLLYLEAAHKMLLTSEVVLSQAPPKFMKVSKDGEAIIFDADADQTNPIFNSLLQYKICSIIMLHAAVEAFINEFIPDNISYPTTDKEGKPIQIGKEKVFWVPFPEKLKRVIPFVVGSSLSASIADKIDFIAQVRNDFVHLKSESSDVLKQTHSSTFHDILKRDLQIYFDAVHDFINLLKPGYIKYHSPPPAEE